MSKPSEAKIEANRNNAKHSRGPRSASGKHRSSQNALRHGLTGRIVVLPGEDMAEFERFSKEIVDSLNAHSPMERQCAQAIADAQWRLNRARTFEDGMIAMGHFEEAGNFTAENPNIHAALTAAKVFRDRSKDFVNLALYEQRIGKAQKEAFHRLYDLQDRRKASLVTLVDEPAEKAKPLTQAASAAPAQQPDQVELQAARSMATDGHDLSPQAVDGQALSPQMLDCKRNVVVSGFVYSSVATPAVSASQPVILSPNEAAESSRTEEFPLAA